MMSRESILDQLFNCVHSGVEWSIEQLKSTCPPKKKKTQERYTEPKVEKHEEKSEISPPYVETKPYTPPSQICPPKTASYCFIKMQDPYAPCCCETKPQPPPCPPKPHRRQPRESICGCDLCRKQPDSRCCDQTADFRGAARDPRYFERA